jgi:NRPS condensation-like uncharacterized protein
VRSGIADRVLDVNTDDFEERSPLDGLDEQPLLSFKEVTEAHPFASKFPGLTKFIDVSMEAGRIKILKTEAQVHRLTVDDIAMIVLCAMLLLAFFI